MSDPNAILVWRFEDAPEALRNLSTHGGDEDWLAVLPRSLAPHAPEGWPEGTDEDAYRLPSWMWSGSELGRFVSVQPHPDSAQHVVVIGAQA